MALTEQQLEETTVRVSQEMCLALNDDEAIELVRGVLAALPASEQKPEFYYWKHNEGDFTPQLSQNSGPSDKWTITPLFTHSPDSAARIKELEAELDLANQQMVCIETNASHDRGMAELRESALKEKLRVAREAIKNAEQAVFEEWLQQECPSGDVESVQRQWETSKPSDEFNSYFGEAIATIGEE